MSLRHKYHQHRFQVVVRFHTGILALTSRIFCKIPKALSHLRCRKTKHTQKKLFGTHATLRTARVALWFLDVSSSRAKTHTHTHPAALGPPDARARPHAAIAWGEGTEGDWRGDRGDWRGAKAFYRCLDVTRLDVDWNGAHGDRCRWMSS